MITSVSHALWIIRLGSQHPLSSNFSQQFIVPRIGTQTRTHKPYPIDVTVIFVLTLSLAQGMPECSGCTCMLVCAFTPSLAHETAGAASTRHSLLPLRREKVHGKTRAPCAARTRIHIHLSSSAKADDPVFQRHQ